MAIHSFHASKAWHQVFESFECFRDADESDLLPFLTGGYQLNRFLFGLVTILKTTISHPTCRTPQESPAQCFASTCRGGSELSFYWTELMAGHWEDPK